MKFKPIKWNIKPRNLDIQNILYDINNMSEKIDYSNLYIIVYNSLTLNNQEIANVLSINIDSIITIALKYDGKIISYTKSSTFGYCVFTSLDNAKEFAKWLNSLCVFNKLKGEVKK